MKSHNRPERLDSSIGTPCYNTRKPAVAAYNAGKKQRESLEAERTGKVTIRKGGVLAVDESVSSLVGALSPVNLKGQ